MAPRRNLQDLWETLTPAGQHHLLTGQPAPASTMKSLERRNILEFRENAWKKWSLTNLGTRLRTHAKRRIAQS